MAIEDELGRLLPGAGGGGTWQSWLSDPVNRAGLLSFGAQALTGGGGTFGQEMGAALAKGFEGAQGTEALIHARQEADEEQARKSAEAAAGRASQLQITREQIAGREEVASQRIAGMLEGIKARGGTAIDVANIRAGAAGGAGKGGLTRNQAIQRAIDLTKNPLSFDKMSPQEQQDVLDLADRLQGITPGAPAPGAVAPAPAATPTAGAAPAAPKTPTEELAVLMQDPEIAQAMKTSPQFRAGVLQRMPHLKKEMEAYEKSLGRLGVAR